MRLALVRSINIGGMSSHPRSHKLIFLVGRHFQLSRGKDNFVLIDSCNVKHLSDVQKFLLNKKGLSLLLNLYRSGS
jgi:hypothetical protein